MGGFIAALRKANGLTQRDLAEKLNVSDKAVSRWERDECAPDLMLIPAIAEIFDVTTDELLNGGRIANLDCAKTEPKKEKQVRAMANRELTKFKSLAIVSIGLSILGVILMFGIALGFIRPYIAICVASSCVLASIIVILIGSSKLHETENSDEILDESNQKIRAEIKTVKLNYCFASFFTELLALAICIPLALKDWGNHRADLMSSYLFDLRYYLLVLLVAFLVAELAVQIAVLADDMIIGNRSAAKLNIVHILAGSATGACFSLSKTYLVVSVGLIFVMIIVIPIFAVVIRKDIKVILVSGIRNILLILDFVFVKPFALPFNSDYTNMSNIFMFVGIAFALAIVVIAHFILKSIKTKNVGLSPKKFN